MMKKKNITLLFVLAVLSGTASAQWKQSSGIEGPPVRVLCVHDQYVLAGIQGGVYVSSDTGRSWITYENRLTGDNILSLASNKKYVFCGSTSGLYRSSDNGKSWDSIETDTRIPSVVTMGDTLFYFFGQSNVNLIYSFDNGNRIDRIRDIDYNGGITELHVRDKILFIRTGEGKIFRSSDCGKTSQQLNILGQIIHFNTTKLALFVYVIDRDSSDYYLYRSTDNGDTWIKIDTTIFSYPNFVAGITSSDSVVYASTSRHGLYRSVDTGRSWTLMTTTLPYGWGNDGPIELVIKDSYLLAGGYSSYGTFGILRSSDEGKTWSAGNKGLNTEATSVITIDDKYFCASWDGLYSSIDKGQTWIRSDSFPRTVVRDVIQNKSFLFAATSRSVYCSQDTARSWRKIDLPQQAYPVKFFANGLDLFIASNRGVFFSSDEGDTWENRSNGIPPSDGFPNYKFVQSIGGRGLTLFIGDLDSGVYRSTNDGKNWEAVNNGLMVGSLNSGNPSSFGQFSFLDDSTVFVIDAQHGTLHPFYRSTNNGNSWVDITSKTPGNPTALTVVNKTLVLGGSGVWTSSNKGNTWQEHNNGLLGYSLGKYLGTNYVGIAGDQLFASTELGLWYRPLSEVVGIEEEVQQLSQMNSLQTYPNPFTNSTTISYSLPTLGHVKIKIFDCLGCEVQTLVNENEEAGLHRAMFNASALTAGTYFCLLQMNDRVESRTMIVVK